MYLTTRRDKTHLLNGESKSINERTKISRISYEQSNISEKQSMLTTTYSYDGLNCTNILEKKEKNQRISSRS